MRTAKVAPLSPLACSRFKVQTMTAKRPGLLGFFREDRDCEEPMFYHPVWNSRILSLLAISP
jgi:hypothetical protein